MCVYVCVTRAHVCVGIYVGIAALTNLFSVHQATYLFVYYYFFQSIEPQNIFIYQNSKPINETILCILSE